MSYQKCPVCEGKQTVPGGFYYDSLVREKCRSCNGNGVLLVPSTNPVYGRDPNVFGYAPPFIFNPHWKAVDTVVSTE